MGKRAICVYAKPPLPGRAKARLAGAIGAEAAAEVAYALLHDLLDRLRQIAPHLEAEVMIWYPPDALPEEFAPEFRGNITFLQQAGDDLGERMSNTFQYLLNEEGYDSALILGSDCVTFTEEVLGTAFVKCQKISEVRKTSVCRSIALYEHTKIIYERPAKNRNVTLIQLKRHTKEILLSFFNYGF